MNGVSLRDLTALSAVGIVLATLGTQRAWGSERLTDEQLGQVVGRTTGQYICSTKPCEEGVAVTCEREEGTNKCWTVWVLNVHYCKGGQPSGHDYCEKDFDLMPMDCCTAGAYWTSPPDQACQCSWDGSGTWGNGGCNYASGCRYTPSTIGV